MVLTQTIEDIAEWIQENICSQIKLLKPDDEQMGRGYAPEYVHPIAFPMYIPAKDCLPPDVEQKLPAICIQLIDGNDDMTKYEETLHIRLAFAVWRPGTYRTVEITEENENKSTTMEFIKGVDGWKDIWNFVERAKRIIQKNMYIKGMRVDRKEPMKFGFFTNDETMVNAYPEWYAWLSFTVRYGTVATPVKQYQEML